MDKGSPYHLFKQVELVWTNGQPMKKVEAPFEFKIVQVADQPMSVKLTFIGHYDEPDLILPVTKGKYKVELDFSSTEKRKQWQVTSLW